MSKKQQPQPLSKKHTREMLMQAISKFYSGEKTHRSLEKFYRAAYNLVLRNKGGELYSAVETTMTSVVQSLCRPLDDDAAPVDSALFLQELVTRWDRHSFALNSICDVFMYMDRCFVTTNFKTAIKELGLRLWRDEMARSDKIRQRLTVEVMLQKVGEGELVPGLDKMLTELGADVKRKDNLPFLCFQDDDGTGVQDCM